MKKCRIGLLTEWFLPNTGGGETYVLEQVKWFAAQGHEVHLFIPDYLFGKIPRQQQRQLPCKLHALKSADRKYHRRKNLMTGHYNNYWAGVQALALANAAAIQSQVLDILHIHSITYAYMGIMLGRILEIPTVVTLHLNYLTVPMFFCTPVCRGFEQEKCNVCRINPAWLKERREKAWDMGVRKYHIDNADRVISLTRSFKRDLLRYQHLRAKIEVIPSGVNTRLFKPGKKDPHMLAKLNLHPQDQVIMLISRIFRQKGLEYLVKAMPRILKAVPNAKLVVVGRVEGRLANLFYREVRQTVRRLKIRDQVIFSRDFTYGDMPEVFRAADVLVHPSFSETQGLVLLEAMATKIPVVASDIANIRELIKSGRNGLLVEPKDVRGISRAVIRILGDQPFKAKIIKNGYDTINRRYTTEISFKKLLEVYRQLMQIN